MIKGLKAAQLIFLLALIAVAAVYLAVSLSNLISSTSLVGAATAPPGSFNTMTLSGPDTIYNWDFNSNSVRYDNVDWGLRFIFWDNAEVDYVKDRLDGDNNDPSIYPQLDASSLYKGSKSAYVHDGPEQPHGMTPFDKDKGIKDWPGVCELNWGHMRVYARSGADRNYSPGWGYYVVASVHLDQELTSSEVCEPYFESTEDDEDKWVERIENNLSVSPHNWDVDGYKDFGNASSLVNIAAANEDPHWYQSDGFGRTVQVSGN